MLGIASLQGASAHNWYHDDGCQPGTTGDGYFWAAGPASDWGTYQVGWGGCSMYTVTKPNTLINPDQWAEWYLPIDSNYNHTYNLYHYQPDIGVYCSSKTNSAHYHSWPNGHDGGIGSHYYQAESCTDYCTYIGQKALNGSNGGLADVWDATGESGTWLLFVDAFCFYEP